MDGAFHYRQSERLISMVENLTGSETKDEIAALIWLAQVHADLAKAAAVIEAPSPGQRWRDALGAQIAPVPGAQVAPVAAGDETTTTTTVTKRSRRRKAAEK